ncbi:glucooligosaccharide oxidase [Diplocarpon rosae]|nr:glucooligosaccharide oxidase [Diplocarpon rosae]
MYYLALAPLLGGWLIAANSATAAAAYSPRRPRHDVTNCLDADHVPYLIQSSSNWSSYATPYNLRLVYEPAVITIPESPDQVSSSVTCAAAAGLKVQAKGGGHSYASYSSGGQDGSLIVDMEKFSSVELDPHTFIAKIGAGQRLGNIATQIYQQGQRGLPHGTCPGVGIAGHALHGGYGYASRKWSVTLDTITGLDVVLSNGTQIYTSAAQHPDLFYAMRGAGDAFAIVTFFYLQTQPAPSSVASFSVGLASALQDLATNSQPLTTAAIRAFWAAVIAHQGRGPFYSIINLYGGPGSAINRPPPEAAAYSDRDALWVFQNYGYTATGQPPWDPATTQLIDGLNAAVERAQPEGAFAAYLNYVDPGLSPTMAAEAYYGATTYNRLLDIKMRLDPTLVFWNPQAVGNAVALPV